MNDIGVKIKLKGTMTVVKAKCEDCERRYPRRLFGRCYSDAKRRKFIRKSSDCCSNFKRKPTDLNGV